MPIPIAALFAKQAAGMALNEAQKPGGVGRLLGIGIGGAIAVIMIPIVLLALVMQSIGGSFTSVVAAEAAERGMCPTNPSSGFLNAQVVGEGNQKENALLIAKVVKDAGLGDRGAQLAVYVAYAESRLKNIPYGHDTSRGLFQQIDDWAWGKPGNRKWQGPWSGKTPPEGETTAEYFRQSNAYDDEEWASNDSRMDPVAATTAFVEAFKEQLERRGISWKEWAANPSPLTDQELFDNAYMVQRFDMAIEQRGGNYKRSLREARPYLNAIVGTTAYTEDVETDPNAATGDREQNGVLILGDSLAVGYANAAPDVGFGGPISSYAFTGASAQQFLTRQYVNLNMPTRTETVSQLKSGPTRVVVSLGTNNPISPAELKENLTELFRMAEPTTVFYLVDLHVDPTGGSREEYNAMFQDLAGFFNARPKLADVVVIGTQDLWAAEGNAAEDKIHWTSQGYQQTWDRISTIMSGGDPTMVTAMFADCDPDTMGQPVSVPSVDLTELENAVTDAQKDVDRLCQVDSVECDDARRRLREAETTLEEAKSASGAAAIAIAYAMEQVGEPYLLDPPGARPPDSWDCSKLTYYAYKEAGVNLAAAYSYTQWEIVTRITKESVRPGDLVFWFRNGAHHVALVSAVDKKGIQIVEAANPDADVRVRYLGGSWDEQHLTGYGRPPVVKG